MCVVFELLTNDEWGFGFPSSDIDLTNFQGAGNTLFNEGNGFSMLLDNRIEAEELLNEIERQIDGIIYLDRRTNKFKITLARGGYDIDSVPEIVDNDNLVSLTEWSRGTWEETSNQVRVSFTDRSRDYFDTFAQAHDLANLRIQQGEVVSSELTFPGVKNKSLANHIASRELKALSAPLARATAVVTRDFHEINPGDVVSVTDADLGVTKFPMRVGKISYGTLLDGKITMSLVQDIFEFATPFFAEPDATRWTLPEQPVEAAPEEENVVFEAPLAFTIRDKDQPDVSDRFWASSRGQTGFEISQRFWQRNHPTIPSGAFVDSGESFAFMLIGTLGADLGVGTPNPTTSPLRLDAGPDTLADMLEEFAQGPSASDIGQNLTNLILVDDEFMAVTTATDQGTHINLGGVYRGLLDSAAAAHSSGTPVYLLFTGGALSFDSIPQTNVVDVQLRQESRFDVVTELEATTLQFQMANRTLSPYPPSELELNGNRYDTTVDLDILKTGGTTLDERGIELTFVRRDLRRFDEVEGLTVDAATLDPTFPAADDTRYRAILREGALVLVDTGFNMGEATLFASRTRILRLTGGVFATDVSVEIQTRRTESGVDYDALQTLDFDFSTFSTSLANDVFMGILGLNDVSTVFTSPTTGTLSFSIGTALASGDVEARVNGGSFAVVIASGNTSGSIGVTAGDEVEVRHTQTGSTDSETFLLLNSPSSTVDGFAILTF